MPQPDTAPPIDTRRLWPWLLILVGLLILRVPSLMQPPGGDQGLYHYVATRIWAGDVPYRDAWEQKPPGIFYTYAALSSIVPGRWLIPGADLGAAAATAWLLILLGRRLTAAPAGELAASLYLIVGDPAIQKLAGLHLRAQCETFIGLAVTLALWTVCRAPGSAGAAVAAGVALGCATWLKYNAIVYALPVAIAIVFVAPGSTRAAAKRVGACAAGLAATLGLGVAGFAAAGALADLRLATLDYNLAYSSETYRSPFDVIRYLVSMPVTRAGIDGLWFLGGLGVLLLIAGGRWRRPPTWIIMAWVAAAIASIAVNGSRGLPQYFIQAAPALATAASLGLVETWRARRVSRLSAGILWASVALLVAGFWRVGVEPGPLWRPRAFGVPEAVRNMSFDLRAMSGAIPRGEYLSRFDRGEGGKHSPAAIERLVHHVRDHTASGTRIYVFGFASGEVYVRSERPSASRFFWSRPIVLEFEGGRPGYGSVALLHDLQSASPEIVALQKHDWGLAETLANSLEFFMASPSLRGWLERNYIFDYEDHAYAVWRRKA